MKNVKIARLDSLDIVSVDQFETKEREYFKYNTKTNEEETKSTQRCERETCRMPLQDVFSKHLNSKKKYTPA